MYRNLQKTVRFTRLRPLRRKIKKIHNLMWTA